MAPSDRRGSSPKTGVVVQVFGRTDVGRAREHNEDAFLVADLTSGHVAPQPEVKTHVSGEMGTLFMVADGMGGAAAGEIASAMAVEIILGELKEHWMKAQAHDPDTFASTLRQATDTANTQIHRFAAEHPEHRGMGTTATIAGLLGDTLYLAQVGDSRAYLVRDGAAKQITKDQSLMQKLIEAGELTPEEAEQSDRRNIILQALGPEPRIRIDLTHQKVRRGDVLVLCSDGLSGQVRADEIGRIVGEEPDLSAVCRKLIDRANENGGPDNITVVAARFMGDMLEAASTGDDVKYTVFPMAGMDETTIPVEAYVPRSAPEAAVSGRATPSSVPPPVMQPARARGMRSLLVLLALLILLAAVLAARRMGWLERFQRPEPMPDVPVAVPRTDTAAAPVAAPLSDSLGAPATPTARPDSSPALPPQP